MNTPEIASAIGKGLLAGIVGTAVITLSSTIEMKLRGRAPSEAPAKAASKVTGFEPDSERSKKRLSNIVHWTYGTLWGGFRGLLAAFGLHGAPAAAVHFAAVWGTALVMLPALKVAPPATEQGVKEIAIDGLHHAAYASAAGAAFDLLDR